MGLLEFLIGAGGSGILTTIVSQVFSIVRISQERKNKALEFEQELKLQEMQFKSLQHETEREIFITETNASTQALTGAYQHDSEIGSVSKWVRNVIKLYRPTLTTLLLILTAVLFFATDDLTIKSYIAYGVVFATISAITFWFGDRTIAKNVQGATKLPWAN